MREQVDLLKKEHKYDRNFTLKRDYIQDKKRSPN